MPHNFRITGTRYVSKALVANDSNAGTDPNLPKKTIAGGLSGLAASSTLVVGTGVYKEAITLSINITIRADGNAVLQGNGANTISSSQPWQMIGCLIRGYTQIICNSRSSGGERFLQCVILCEIDIRGNGSANYLRAIESCIVTENVVNTDLAGAVSTAPSCIYAKNIFLKDFVFSHNNGGGSFRNNYIAGNLIFLGFHSTFSHNNIRGTIRFQAGGIQYAVRDQLAGTPQDNGYAAGVVWATGTAIRAELGSDTRGTIAQWDAAIATCINREPHFNNPEKLDFTLKPNSPHIGRANDGTNIGGTNVAVSYLVTSLTNMRSNSLPAPVDVALEPDANLQLAGLSDIDIASGTSGKVKTGWFRVNTTNKQVRTLRYIGNLNFNVDTVAPNSENENVPAVSLYGSGTAGENPERLTIAMQWHTGSDIPVGDTGNNGGLAPVGTFQPFLINQVPTIDTGAKTNGAPDHNPATASGINAVWVRFEVTLNNNFA